jgi:hypothetical protein
VELLFDREGHSLRSWDISVEEAVWRRGFIHIRSVDRSLIVSLNPQLVGPVTKAAAYYEIADLNPERTIVCAAGPNWRGEVFLGFRPAFRTIYALGVAIGTEIFYPGYAVIELAAVLGQGFFYKENRSAADRDRSPIRVARLWER